MSGVAAALIAIQVGSTVLSGLEAARGLRGSAASLEEQAAQALALGRLRAKRTREAGERVGGRIRALTAAAGLELSGSPLAVEIDNAMQVEKQAGDIFWAAEIHSRNLQSEAQRRREAAGRLKGIGLLTGTSAALIGGSRAGFFDPQSATGGVVSTTGDSGGGPPPT